MGVAGKCVMNDSVCYVTDTICDVVSQVLCRTWQTAHDMMYGIGMMIRYIYGLCRYDLTWCFKTPA